MKGLDEKLEIPLTTINEELLNKKESTNELIDSNSLNKESDSSKIVSNNDHQFEQYFECYFKIVVSSALLHPEESSYFSPTNEEESDSSKRTIS